MGDCRPYSSPEIASTSTEMAKSTSLSSRTVRPRNSVKNDPPLKIVNLGNFEAIKSVQLSHATHKVKNVSLAKMGVFGTKLRFLGKKDTIKFMFRQKTKIINDD
jgi:hypothetical protein